MWMSKIKTILFPVSGLDLSPVSPEGEVNIVGDVQPTLAILVGMGDNGLVAIEATPDGAAKVADTGSGLTLVDVATGIATNTLTDLALTNSFTLLVITVTNAALQIKYETSPGAYSSAIDLKIGEHERDMSAEDLQVANALAGDPATYQIEAYR